MKIWEEEAFFKRIISLFEKKRRGDVESTGQDIRHNLRDGEQSQGRR